MYCSLIFTNKHCTSFSVTIKHCALLVSLTNTVHYLVSLSTKLTECVTWRSDIECWSGMLLKVVVGIKIKWSLLSRHSSGGNRDKNITSLKSAGNRVYPDLLHLFSCTFLPFIAISLPIETVNQNIMSCDWTRAHSFVYKVPSATVTGRYIKFVTENFKCKWILQ